MTQIPFPICKLPYRLFVTSHHYRITPSVQNRGGDSAYAKAGGRIGACQNAHLAPPLGELACAARLRGYQWRNPHEGLSASQPSQSRRFRRDSSPIGRAKGYDKSQFPGQTKIPFSFGRILRKKRVRCPIRAAHPDDAAFTLPRCWVRRGWQSSRECGCIFRSGLCTGTAPGRPGCR